MSYATRVKALKEYKNVDVATGIEGASPHRLILMLMEGALSRMNQARIHIINKNISERGELISLTISIIGGLRDSLDHDAGGEIAANLDALYDYMTRCLIEINIKNDLDKLEEVIQLLQQIRSAWIEVEPQTTDAVPNNTNSATAFGATG